MGGGPAVASEWRDGPGGVRVRAGALARRGLPAVLWIPALIVLLPVLVVVWRGLQPGGDSWSAMLEHRLHGYVVDSIILAVSVVILTIIIGVATAWYVSVYDFPGRRFLEWGMLLPLTMPGYIAAVAYVDALNALVPFYVWVRQTYGLEAFRMTQTVAPWVFATLVLALTLFPYVYLTCRAAFSRQSVGVLDAARMLGAGHGRMFRKVAFPLARPAVAAGASLVAFETLNDFGTVSRFGLSTLTPGIYRAWGDGDLVSAMRLAMILVFLAMAGIAIERRQRGRRRYATEAAEAVLPRRRLGRAGAAKAWAVCGIPLALGFAIPAGRLARWAVQSWEGMTTEQWADCRAAALHSFSLSAGTAVLVTIGALWLAGGKRAVRGGAAGLAERIGSLGYAFPGALVAVGIGALVSSVAAWNFPGAAHLALSASVFGLMLACFVRFLAAGLNPVSSGFAKVSGSLHDAARTLGAGPLRSLRKIDFPLVYPAVAAGAALVFLDVFKELTMTLVLRPFDYETLATRTFRLADEGRIPEAAVPALILVGFSLAGIVPLTWLLRRATR